MPVSQPGPGGWLPLRDVDGDVRGVHISRIDLNVNPILPLTIWLRKEQSYYSKKRKAA